MSSGVYLSDVTTFTQHEKASVDMFWHMLKNQENQHVRDGFKRWNLSIEKHGKIIANLIMGKPDEDNPERDSCMRYVTL